MLLSKSKHSFRHLLNEKFKLKYKKNKETDIGELTNEVIQIILRSPFRESDVHEILNKISVLFSQQRFNLLHKMIISIDNDDLKTRLMWIISKLVGNCTFSFQVSPEESAFYFTQLFFSNNQEFSANIIASLYDSNETVRHQFKEANCISFIMVHSNPPIFSKLILKFTKSFPNEFVQCLPKIFDIILQLIFHKSLNVSADGIESLINLIEQKFVTSISDDMAQTLATHLFTILYDESPRNITLSLKLLILLNIPPFEHIVMLKTFMESRATSIELAVLQVFRHFADIITNCNQEEMIKQILFRAIQTQPQIVRFNSLITLFSFKRSHEEDELIIDELTEFVENEDTSKDALIGILSILRSENESPNLISRVNSTSAFDELLYSDDEEILQMANEIVSLIDNC